MKIRKNCRKSQFRYLEKGTLELCCAAKTKLKQIERSGFFLLDHNEQTRVYRLVSGPTDVPRVIKSCKHGKRKLTRKTLQKFTNK